MMRLDGIQASNRGAYILGMLPCNRSAGKNFKLQANQFANGDQVWDCTFMSAEATEMPAGPPSS